MPSAAASNVEGDHQSLSLSIYKPAKSSINEETCGRCERLLGVIDFMRSAPEVVCRHPLYSCARRGSSRCRGWRFCAFVLLLASASVSVAYLLLRRKRVLRRTSVDALSRGRPHGAKRSICGHGRWDARARARAPRNFTVRIAL